MLGTIADIIEISTFCVSIYLLLRSRNKPKVNLRKKDAKSRLIPKGFSLRYCLVNGAFALAVIGVFSIFIPAIIPSIPEAIIAITFCASLTVILISTLCVMCDIVNE